MTMGDMLRSVHLVGEDENEDLYADFEQDYNPAFDTEVFSSIKRVLV